MYVCLKKLASLNHTSTYSCYIHQLVVNIKMSKICKYLPLPANNCLSTFVSQMCVCVCFCHNQ